MEVVWQKDYFSEGKEWKAGFKFDGFSKYYPFTSEKKCQTEDVYEIPMVLDNDQYKNAIVKITDCPFKDMKGNFKYFTMVVTGACQIATKDFLNMI